MLSILGFSLIFLLFPSPYHCFTSIFFLIIIFSLYTCPYHFNLRSCTFLDISPTFIDPLIISYSVSALLLHFSQIQLHTAPVRAFVTAPLSQFVYNTLFPFETLSKSSSSHLLTFPPLHIVTKAGFIAILYTLTCNLVRYNMFLSRTSFQVISLLISVDKFPSAGGLHLTWNSDYIGACFPSTYLQPQVFWRPLYTSSFRFFSISSLLLIYINYRCH